MRGFQLWINLPAAEKMKPAAYRDIPSEEIPMVNLPEGGRIKIIAGEVEIDGVKTAGPINGLSTAPIYWDLHLPADASFTQSVPAEHNLFVYVYQGAIVLGEDQRQVSCGNAGLTFKGGDQLLIKSLGEESRLLILAGKPIREPVVQYGPFVMNTPEEIEQAIMDYRSGAF